MAIARIALDVPLETLFDYRTGDFSPVPGQLVVVPFGRRRDVGVVAELAERSKIADARLRRIERILPLDPLPADLLALIRFCFAAGYQARPLQRTESAMGVCAHPRRARVTC